MNKQPPTKVFTELDYKQLADAFINGMPKEAVDAVLEEQRALGGIGEHVFWSEIVPEERAYNESKTTIAVNRYIRDVLKAMLGKGDTYDDVIKRLVSGHFHISTEARHAFEGLRRPRETDEALFKRLAHDVPRTGDGREPDR